MSSSIAVAALISATVREGGDEPGTMGKVVSELIGVGDGGGWGAVALGVRPKSPLMREN